MDKNQPILVIGVVLAIVIAGLALFTHGASLGSVIDGNFTSYNAVKLTDSADQLQFNGNTNVSVKRILSTSGTTTPCAILSPSATSTLLSFTFMPTVGTTTASTLTLATSTTAYATTSALAGASAVSYTPTRAYSWAAGKDDSIVYPSTYLVLGLAAGTASGGHVMTGVCVANFQTAS